MCVGWRCAVPLPVGLGFYKDSSLFSGIVGLRFLPQIISFSQMLMGK